MTAALALYRVLGGAFAVAALLWLSPRVAESAAELGPWASASCTVLTIFTTFAGLVLMLALGEIGLEKIVHRLAR